jgi:hypothetical protein
VENLRYLGVTLTESNYIQEEFKNKLRECLSLHISEYSSFPLIFINVKIKIYKTITLDVLLYGCKTWSLSLRQEHRLRNSEKGNRTLCIIFVLKRYNETKGWSKLHNELLNVHSSSDIIKMIIITGNERGM